MNKAKHPRFVKSLDPAMLVAPECPVSEIILETMVYAGIEPTEPIFTKDGDRVRLLAIDAGHQFPIVGEVVDFVAETTWLARWSASGVYASSNASARAKHSLALNREPGEAVCAPTFICAACHAAPNIAVEVVLVPPPCEAFSKPDRRAANDAPREYIKHADGHSRDTDRTFTHAPKFLEPEGDEPRDPPPASRPRDEVKRNIPAAAMEYARKAEAAAAAAANLTWLMAEEIKKCA